MQEDIAAFKDYTAEDAKGGGAPKKAAPKPSEDKKEGKQEAAPQQQPQQQQQKPSQPKQPSGQRLLSEVHLSNICMPASTHAAHFVTIVNLTYCGFQGRYLCEIVTCMWVHLV